MQYYNYNNYFFLIMVAQYNKFSCNVDASIDFLEL